MGAARSHRNRTWLTLPRWLTLCALGISLLILSAILRGTPENISWYLWHVLPGVTFAVFSATTLGGRVAPAALLAYAVVLPKLTLLAGFGLVNASDGFRVQLFTDNANLLGADLVAVTFAAIAMRPTLPWAPYLPLVAIAVLLTGSRTSALAMCLALVVWLVVSRGSMRSRVAALTGFVMIASIIIFAFSQAIREDRPHNLLHMSTTFEHSLWSTFGDAAIVVMRGVADGPFASTRADRVQAVTHQHPLVVYQDAARSLDGRPYVASVYLRADAAQVLVLSSHLSRIMCSVDSVWRRCVTPVGVGDGLSSAQFRLESLAPGDGFDVFIYGPQVEIGQSPSAYAERRAPLLPPSLMRRFAPSSLDSKESRLGVMKEAFDSWLGDPVLGTGFPSRTPRLVDGDPPVVTESAVERTTHAHNLLLERLASDGLIGLVGWALIACPLLAAALQRSPRRLLPWLTALFVLNSLDMTLFHAGSYFSAAIVSSSGLPRKLTMTAIGCCAEVRGGRHASRPND